MRVDASTIYMWPSAGDIALALLHVLVVIAAAGDGPHAIAIARLHRVALCTCMCVDPAMKHGLHRNLSVLA